MLAALCAVALVVSTLVFVAGMALRVTQWLRTPQPWPVPTTPAPTTAAGAAGRLLRETFFFESLWRASRWTWLAGFAFHLALLLAFLGHLRFVTAPLWPALPDTGALATAVGVLMVVSLLALWARRLLVDRVRYVSVASDHGWLALLLAVAGSGLAMGHEAGLAVREFVWGLAAGELRPLPEGAAAPAHLLLVSALLAAFPFSKLLHGPALWFNPTRYQPDRARLRRQGGGA